MVDNFKCFLVNQNYIFLRWLSPFCLAQPQVYCIKKSDNDEKIVKGCISLIIRTKTDLYPLRTK